MYYDSMMKLSKIKNCCCFFDSALNKSKRIFQYLRQVKFNEKSKYPLELIKRRSKVHEKNVSREYALNFD